MLKARSLLYYGRTKVGKTANLKMLAKGFYDRHKLKIRIVHSDGGGYRPFDDSDNLIGKGIVEVVDNTDRELALQDIHRLADGCWINKNGDIVRSSIFGGDGANGGKVNKEARRKLFEKEEIGAYFVEGTGSLSDVLLSHFSDQLYGDAIGFDAPWKYREGDYGIAGLQPGHYGIVQRELHKLVVKKFCQLPVKLVVFTAKPIIGIETTYKTKRSGEKYATSQGEPIFGPEGPGIALTSKIPSWFENCLFLQTKNFKSKDGKVVEKRIAWYRTHSEKMMIEGSPTEVPYLAGSSCPAEKVEELEERFPGGYLVLDTERGLDRYIEWLEEIDRHETTN